MKSKTTIWIALSLVSGWSAMATNVYVVPPGTPGAAPSAPYTSWATAATNIADAVNAINITDGNIVFISNGTYKLSDEIVVDKGVVLRSWNDGQTDRDGTIIDGNNYPGKPVTNRVFYMSHAEAVLDGLTIRGGQGGAGYAGGILVYQSAMITNCAVIENAADASGAGGILLNKNATFGVITHCLIASNKAFSGGGVYIGVNTKGCVEYCQIVSNRAVAGDSATGGGGVYLYNPAEDTVVRNCLIAWNTTASEGGGVFSLYRGVVENCMIVSNHSTSGTTWRHGAGVHFYTRGLAGVPVLRNCLVQGNTAAVYTRGAVGVELGNQFPCNEVAARIENCTIVDNPGIRGYRRYNAGTPAPTSAVHFVNSVLYGHTQEIHQDVHMTQTYFTNCLSSVELPGDNNITNVAPTFVDGYRLANNSAGVNAGLNQAWMTEPGATDLDRQARIDRFSGKVDMGCYEYLPRGTAFSLR